MKNICGARGAIKNKSGRDKGNKGRNGARGVILT
jgi:hypothetical protein